MNSYSARSEENLKTCHLLLQETFRSALPIMDHSIICGYRNEEAQNRAFEEGNSKLRWPESKHNQLPSLAVDVIPYPVDWIDKSRFFHLAGIVKGIAAMKGVKIKWGGDWDTFRDYAHYELVI